MFIEVMKFTFNREISLENVIAIGAIVTMIAVDHHRIGELENASKRLTDEMNDATHSMNVAAIKMEHVTTFLDTIQLYGKPKEQSVITK